MISLPQLQIIAQLMDNLNITAKKIEEAYNKNDSENFNKSKRELLDIQDKISKMIV